MNTFLGVMLCCGVFAAGFVVIGLATWLVHVARREGGLFHVKTGHFSEWQYSGYGAGRDADLLPQERADNDYLHRMRAAEAIIDRMNAADKEHAS